jgi:hypothetical protein
MSEFYEAVKAEDHKLQQALADIRRRQDAGTISIRQAADERVSVLEAHLAAVRALRREHLGDDGEARHGR